jgi:hypothetical protein
MKQIFYALFLGAIFSTGCSKDQIGNDAQRELRQTTADRDDDDDRGDEETEPCATKTVNLIAGQNTVAGTVSVTQDATSMYVTYTTTGGWVLSKTHLFVGACNAIPVNGGGNPVPGQFPYKTTHSNVTTYTYVVPVSAIGLNNCGCIAAHAALKKLNAAGNVVQQETGWGEGAAINPNGGNWAMKFEFCPVDCQ